MAQTCLIVALDLDPARSRAAIRISAFIDCGISGSRGLTTAIIAHRHLGIG
jgi:hypothetical protein